MDAYIKSIGGLFDKMNFLPNYEMKTAFFGAILIAVIFLLAWLISLGSRMNGLRKKLFKTTVKLSQMERVDEDNVEGVYSELQKLPEPTAKGWGRYLEDRKGYPSDYIAARDVLNKREYTGKYTVAKVFYCVLSVIVGVLCAMALAGLSKGGLSDLGLKDVEFSMVAGVICGVIIPLAVFVGLYFVLDYICGRQRRRLEMSFSSFQDVLDNKVIIPEKEDEEYEDGELKDITKEVDELLGGRMEDDDMDITISINFNHDLLEDTEEEIVETVEEEAEEEVVEVEENEEEEPQPVIMEEPIPVPVDYYYEEPMDEAVAEEEAPAPFIPMTKEEAERYLSVLLVVVDSAMADPETTDEDLEEIAVLIETARMEAFHDEEDQKILEECLMKLASRWRE